MILFVATYISKHKFHVQTSASGEGEIDVGAAPPSKHLISASKQDSMVAQQRPSNVGQLYGARLSKYTKAT